MTPITKKLNQLKKVVKQIVFITQDEIIKQQDFIVQLNRNQLARGIKSTGQSLPEYVDNSKAPSAPGPITLFDTGDFYTGIEPLFGSDGFDMISLDSKMSLLVGKYGAILGLTNENIDLLTERVIPKIQERIKILLE